MHQQHPWFCSQVERCKTALFRLARSIVPSDEDAKDAVAEAVCRAFAHLDELRDPARFKPWILRITANEAYNIVSRSARFVPLDALPAEPAAPGRPCAAESTLWPLIQSLPESLRAPIVLYYYDDLPVREIASILGLREGAVKTRLSRGRQALKTMLEPLEKEDVG